MKSRLRRRGTAFTARRYPLEHARARSAVDAAVTAADRVHDRVRQRARPPARRGRPGHRLPISMVMWSNFLRFVGEGITVGELPGAPGHPEVADALDAGRHGALAVRVRRAPTVRSRSGTAGAARGRCGASGSSAPRPLARRHRRSRRRCSARSSGAGSSGSASARSTSSVRRWARWSKASTSSCPSTSRSCGSERDARRDRRTASGCDAHPPVRTPLSGAPRLHARLRAQVGAVAALEPRTSCASSARRSRRPRGARDRGRVAGGDEHGGEVPDEDRLRHGRRQARPPHAEGPGGAGGGSRAACRGRAGVEDPPAAARRWPRLLDQRASPRACTRIRKAGGPGRSTSTRRTPSSPTRPDGCRTTRWCSTAAGGPTAPSF